MEYCATKEEFIAMMKRCGYGVRWEENRKHLTYTCYREPKYQNGGYKKCRDSKLSDEKWGEKKSVIDRRRREMLAELEPEETRLREGYNSPENYCLIAFLNDWLENVHRYKIQENTLAGYRNRINGKMQAFFGEKLTLDEFKPKLVNKFYDSLRAESVCEQTVLHYHNLFHIAFEYAMRQEIFEYNPMNRVERPQKEKFVGKCYSVEELQTLLVFAENEQIYIPLVLAAYYGVRRSEAIGLSWDNVDFEKKEIRITQKAMEITRNGKREVIVSNKMKTESSRRTLPLIPDVEEILLKHKAKQQAYQKQFRRGYSQKNLNMVCVDQVGELLKPNYVTTRFPKILKKCGLPPIRYHDLRHTCASLLLNKTVNMKIIQMWLGHSNMSTTADIYAHLDVNAKKEAGKAIESLLGFNNNED